MTSAQTARRKNGDRGIDEMMSEWWDTLDPAKKVKILEDFIENPVWMAWK